MVPTIVELTMSVDDFFLFIAENEREMLIHESKPRHLKKSVLMNFFLFIAENERERCFSDFLFVHC